MLIIVLGLTTKLALVCGDCDVGASKVKNFDFPKIGINVLTSEVEDFYWNEVGVGVMTGFLKESASKLMLGFVFHLWINRAYLTEYVRVIE